MPQMDKIAIHVPHPLLSEAVQKKLFKMGYGWVFGPKIKDIECDCIVFSPESIDTNLLQHNKDAGGYTILTVDEFFKREAKKDRIAKISCYGIAVVVDEVIVIKKPEDRGRVLVKITWQEYDEIGKLRPKEATDA